MKTRNAVWACPRAGRNPVNGVDNGITVPGRATRRERRAYYRCAARAMNGPEGGGHFSLAQAFTPVERERNHHFLFSSAPFRGREGFDPDAMVAPEPIPPLKGLQEEMQISDGPPFHRRKRLG
jgi:hypothetical protein